MNIPSQIINKNYQEIKKKETKKTKEIVPNLKSCHLFTFSFQNKSRNQEIKKSRNQEINTFINRTFLTCLID